MSIESITRPSLISRAADYLGLAWVKWALLVAALGCAVIAMTAYKQSLRAEGAEKERAEQLKSANRNLQDAIDALKVQTKKTKDIQDEYQSQQDEIIGLRSRFAAASDRMRRLTAGTNAAVGTASTNGLREFAKACQDNFERSRDHVERFGFEAASCSSAAHALKKSNDVLSNLPSPPIPPAKPDPMK